MSDYKGDSFLDYIHKPMSRDKIDKIYKQYGVNLEKCELYKDFTLSLLFLIFDTYMGDDLMSTDDQINHFNWCWIKNNDTFKKEGLKFEDELLYEYFFEFMFEVFYSSPKLLGYNYVDKPLITIWVDLFNFKNNKTNSELDALIELYLIFEKSLKNTN